MRTSRKIKIPPRGPVSFVVIGLLSFRAVVNFGLLDGSFEKEVTVVAGVG